MTRALRLSGLLSAALIATTLAFAATSMAADPAPCSSSLYVSSSRPNEIRVTLLGCDYSAADSGIDYKVVIKGPETVTVYAGTDEFWTKWVTGLTPGTYREWITGPSFVSDGAGGGSVKSVTGSDASIRLPDYTPAPTPTPEPKPTPKPNTTPRPDPTTRPVTTPRPDPTVAPSVATSVEPVITPIDDGSGRRDYDSNPTYVTVSVIIPTPAPIEPSVAPLVISSPSPAPIVEPGIGNPPSGMDGGLIAIVIGLILVALAGPLALIVRRRRGSPARGPRLSGGVTRGGPPLD